MARYRSNGKLDPSFGGGGKVITSFSGLDDRARAVVVQADGKLVAAGYALTETSRDFAVARYQPNGSLDAGFGTGGKVTTDFTGFVDEANGVEAQADGRLVAAGLTATPTCCDFALARYLAR